MLTESMSSADGPTRPDQARDRLLERFESGAFIGFDDVTFSDGIDTDSKTGSLVNAYMADTFDDGSPRLRGGRWAA